MKRIHRLGGLVAARNHLAPSQHASHDNAWARARDFVGACLLILVFLLAQTAAAQSKEVEPNHAGLWLHSLEDSAASASSDLSSESANSKAEGRVQSLTLETHMEVTVSGPLARTRVTQRFRNPMQLWAEGHYSFPLPVDAAVDVLRMYVGERVVRGEIQEKAKAKKVYNQAVREGKRASLLSQTRGNEFKTRVANIAPGEEVRVEFEFQHRMPFGQHGYELRLPLVITPPYTPEATSRSAHFVPSQASFRKLGEAPGNPVSIDVDLETGFALRSLKSPSHKIEQTPINDTRYRIQHRGIAQDANRDFVLQWQYAPEHVPQVTVLQEETDSAHYGLLMVMPPARDSVAAEQSRELVLVLDVSGSMQGESIRQAKASALKALETLRPTDAFNLILFNNHVRSLFQEALPANARNLQKARSRIQGIQAGGGTEMLPALERALRSRGESEGENLRQVVFMTDGAVTNEDRLFALIKQTLGESRLFTVGIGSAPNHYFMRKAAQAGRGTFTYVGQTSELDRKISHLMQTLRSPALTDIRLDFAGRAQADMPETIADVYAGEPLVMAFRAPDFPDFMTVEGRRAHDQLQFRVPLTSSIRHKGVAVHWARQRIAELESAYAHSHGQAQEGLREQVLSLALNAQQVSRFTSLVAVDEMPARAAGAMSSHKLPMNLPKGWQAKTSSAPQPILLAQTATGLWLRLYLGLAMLALAGVFWLAFAKQTVQESSAKKQRKTRGKKRNDKDGEICLV